MNVGRGECICRLVKLSKKSAHSVKRNSFSFWVMSDHSALHVLIADVYGCIQKREETEAIAEGDSVEK